MPYESAINMVSFLHTSQWHEMGEPTYKTPSHNSIITHIYASIYIHLHILVYPNGCSREILIGKSDGSRRPMSVDKEVATWNGGDGDKMMFGLDELRHFLEVRAIEDGGLMRAMNIT
jgi:hypothetical protein